MLEFISVARPDLSPRSLINRFEPTTKNGPQVGTEQAKHTPVWPEFRRSGAVTRSPPMAEGAEPKARYLYEFSPFRVDPEKELLLHEDETIPVACPSLHTSQVLWISSRDPFRRKCWWC